MLIITFQNISDLAPVSDYEYKVRINHEIIESGIIQGHNRKDGWRKLLEKLVDPNA